MIGTSQGGKCHASVEVVTGQFSIPKDGVDRSRSGQVCSAICLSRFPVGAAFLRGWESFGGRNGLGKVCRYPDQPRKVGKASAHQHRILIHGVRPNVLTGTGAFFWSCRT
jgi:hypothetical protein